MEECSRDVQDPCCYPAQLRQVDFAKNSSAQPCSRHAQPSCDQPDTLWLYFALLLPLVFIIILIILLAVILWLDWRYGGRILYGHVTKRKYKPGGDLHVENAESRARRLDRERIRQEGPGPKY